MYNVHPRSVSVTYIWIYINLFGFDDNQTEKPMDSFQRQLEMSCWRGRMWLGRRGCESHALLILQAFAELGGCAKVSWLRIEQQIVAGVIKCPR